MARKNRIAENPADPTTTSGPELQPHQIILRPLVTEKNLFYSQSNAQYTFEVNPLATKTQIRHAVETLFDVEVDKVMTQTRKGKPRRYRFRFGRTRGFKKAIVRLKGDHRINFF
jgi:large subunit ribosomal protein L23